MIEFLVKDVEDEIDAFYNDTTLSEHIEETKRRNL